MLYVSIAKRTDSPCGTTVAWPSGGSHTALANSNICAGLTNFSWNGFPYRSLVTIPSLEVNWGFAEFEAKLTIGSIAAEFVPLDALSTPKVPPCSCILDDSKDHQMIVRSASGLLSKSAYICPSCARRVRPTSNLQQKRRITQNYLEKTVEAKLAWAKQATEIKSGKQDSMLAMLEKRGFVNQVVG